MDSNCEEGDARSIINLSSPAYRTENLNSLVSQGPLGNGDENIDPDEFLAIPVEAIRDNQGIGFYERLDPARGFEIAEAGDSVQGFALRWRVVPGKQYHVWRSANLADDTLWTRVTVTPVTAPQGADELQFEDETSNNMPYAFYKIESL